MKRAETQISEAQHFKIQATGKSVYEFLQEAIEQKLRNDETLKVEHLINDAIAQRLKDFEKRFEDKLIQGIEISRNILDESIKKDEAFKVKMLENIIKLDAKIQGK